MTEIEQKYANLLPLIKDTNDHQVILAAAKLSGLPVGKTFADDWRKTHGAISAIIRYLDEIDGGPLANKPKKLDVWRDRALGHAEAKRLI